MMNNLYLLKNTYALTAKRIQTTRAKNATPSIKAAAIIIAVLIGPAASGCLPIASKAELANLPIPNPAPITAIPAPIPAPKNPKSILLLLLFINNV
jgi:hypothetical protein